MLTRLFPHGCSPIRVQISTRKPNPGSNYTQGASQTLLIERNEHIVSVHQERMNGIAANMTLRLIMHDVIIDMSA